MIQPVERSRLSLQIVVQLCQLIRQGDLRVGDRLPSERDLAAQLQVSRASLREALRILEASGLVESRHGGGTYVRDFSTVDVISPLSLVLGATDEIVGDLWEIRIIIEPMIATFAAARAGPDQIEALRANLGEQERALAGDPNGMRRLLELDQDFHLAIARASRNRVAVQVLQLINQLIAESRRQFVASEERRRQAYTSHVAIFHAIHAGQPQSAREAMLTHLRQVEEHMLRHLIEPESGDGLT